MIVCTCTRILLLSKTKSVSKLKTQHRTTGPQANSSCRIHLTSSPLFIRTHQLLKLTSVIQKKTTSHLLNSITFRVQRVPIQSDSNQALPRTICLLLALTEQLKPQSAKRSSVRPKMLSSRQPLQLRRIQVRLFVRWSQKNLKYLSHCDCRVSSQFLTIRPR